MTCWISKSDVTANNATVSTSKSNPPLDNSAMSENVANHVMQAPYMRPSYQQQQHNEDVANSEIKSIVDVIKSISNTLSDNNIISEQ